MELVIVEFVLEKEVKMLPAKKTTLNPNQQTQKTKPPYEDS